MTKTGSVRYDFLGSRIIFCILVIVICLIFVICGLLFRIKKNSAQFSVYADAA